MKRRIAAALVGSLGLLVSTTASAEPHTHDGFFMRLGLNFGPNMTSQTIDPGGLESDFSGLQIGSDLMLGGTPVPGLVLGGTLLWGRTADPTVESGGQSRTLDGSLILLGLGFFANYYFDPTQGLHAQAILGYGAIDFVSSSGASGGNDPSGAILGLGVGYDFWIGNQWSVGPFGRVLYSNMSVEEGGVTAKVTQLYPSIGVAFTLH